jgi:excisionase family DNA binding protein
MRLLTADELALRWQVPRGHVYRLARDGRLPCVELGRYKRFSLDAVQDFETAGGTGAKSDTKRTLELR